MENETYNWPGNTPPKPKKKISTKGLARRILFGGLALILLLGIGTCFYTVDDKQ